MYCTQIDKCRVVIGGANMGLRDLLRELLCVGRFLGVPWLYGPDLSLSNNLRCRSMIYGIDFSGVRVPAAPQISQLRMLF